MPLRDTSPEQESAALRARAEAAFLQRAPPGTVKPDAQQLAHELGVHTIELEMQNDELKRAERAVGDSLERYRALYDLAPVAFITLDAGARIHDVNRAAEVLFGLPEEQLVGRTLPSLLRPGDADAFHRLRGEVRATGTARSLEIVLHTAPGGPVVVQLSAVAHPRLGAGTDWLCVAIDESVLRASESRHRALLDAAADGVISLDAVGRIDTFNPAAERLFGYAEADIAGQEVTLILPGFGARTPGGEHVAPNSAPGGPAGAREGVGLRRDGTRFPLELSSGEWSNRGERRTTLIVHDLTGRRAAERQLRDNETRLRQVAEHVGDAILLREADGTVSYLSAAAERLWGRTLAELRADPTCRLDLVHPEDRPTVLERCAGADDGEVLYRTTTAEGDTRWLRERLIHVPDGDGAPRRTILVAQDVTAQRQLDEELRHAMKLEAVGALASGIAHDFGNLLQGILGLAGVAARATTDPDMAQAAARRIIDAVASGRGLVRQLMLYARRDDGEVAPVQVDGLLSRSCDLIGRLIGEGIRLDLVPGGGASRVLADPVQLEQILMNLAANARDAMPDGGVLTIESAAVDLDKAGARSRQLGGAGRYVRLLVRDTGCGMNEQTMRRIFDPFFTTKAVGVGTGLGLATVQTIVRGLGGAVAVESALGQGTTFTIHLPCLPPEG